MINGETAEQVAGEFLLDTGVLKPYLRGRPSVVALIESWMAERRAMTSVLVYGEIVEYLQGLTDFPRREAQLREALRQVYPYPIIPISVETLWFGVRRSKLGAMRRCCRLVATRRRWRTTRGIRLCPAPPSKHTG